MTINYLFPKISADTFLNEIDTIVKTICLSLELDYRTKLIAI